MFQSIWNVAAAYCGHESATQQTVLVNHFGHHALENSSKEQQSSLAAVQEADASGLLNVQDHHDHLPTCFHAIIIQEQQQLKQPILRIHELEQKYNWSNHYQSPYLISLNPPPVFAPLWVG
ncbi:cation efflux protein, CzcI-like [Acinetobacter haemolyticus]|uniref:cation efflux protein, CzcI-like n=1 Tax=Acinetobacter haemolyticus TaxID=29430 RepID=UPI003A4C7C10